MQTGYSAHSQKKSIYSISNIHPKTSMQKKPQDLRSLQYVRFSSALKYIPSDAGAGSSCGISLLLLYALHMKNQECACTGEEELKQVGAGSILSSQWKHTYALSCAQQQHPDVWFT